MKKLVILTTILLLMFAFTLGADTLLNQTFDSDLGSMSGTSVTGSQVWEFSSSYGNPAGCGVMTGYDGTQYENEDWLISPVMDFSGYGIANLNFDEAINYEGSVTDNEKILISTDYTGSGDPNNATWNELTVTGRSSGGSWSFVSVDEVDLSSYTGESTVYLAFKYTSTTSNAGTWEIDNIVVTAATSVTAPTAVTGSATNISGSSALLNGTVNANNASTTVTFEYGLTTAYTDTVTADESPVSGSSDTAVSKAITGLDAETTYHYRVKAINAEGTTYGADSTFTTDVASSNHFVESFENPQDSWSSYTTGTITFDSGDWDFVDVYPESSTNSFDGSKACRINDDVAGASITSPSVNTLGTVSFYYHRPFSGTGTFDLQISENGGAYSTLTSVEYTDQTTPTFFSYDVNSSASNVKVRIQNDDNTAHLTIDYVTLTMYGGSGNVAPTITDITTDPQYPAEDDYVNVTADISDSDGSITSAKLYWGLSESSLTNEINMSPAARLDYITDTSIPYQTEKDTIFYQVEATDDDSETSLSAIQSYIVMPNSVTEIYDIQYTTDPSGDSPYVGEYHTVSGFITATYSGSFVIQDSASAWNGLWIVSDSTVSVGDVADVTGFIEENYNRTQISNPIVMTGSAGKFVPEALVVNTGDINDEKYEGVLVKAENAECTNADLGYGEWEINDGSGACVVYDLGYTYAPTLGSFYNVIGPLNYSFGAFKIEPRDASDISLTGDFEAPEVLSAEAIDSVTVEVEFSEKVDEVTAETVGNYSITALGINVTGAVLTVPDSTLVTLTVDPLAETTYTLVIDGIEDIAGNAMDNVNVSFSYTAPVEMGSIVINEIGEPYDMPNTYKDSYIELYNTTDTSMDVSGWVVWSLDVGKATHSFEFPTGTTIEAGGYLLATRDRTSFLEDYADSVAYVDSTIVPVNANSDGYPVYIGNGFKYAVTTAENDTIDYTGSTLSWNQKVYEKTAPGDDSWNDANWYETYQSTPVQGTPGQANSTGGTLDAPVNVAISHDGSEVTITWDAVTGATYYKVYSCDTPDGTFDEDTSGSFTDESWTATTTASKKFYYVKAFN